MKGPSIKDVRKSGGGVRQKRTWGMLNADKRVKMLWMSFMDGP